MDGRSTQQIDTIVIGAGQAGLSAGYPPRAARAAIRDPRRRTRGSATTGAERWDTLRLYSPARYDSLPGMHASPRRRSTGRRVARWPTTSTRTREGSTCRVRSGTRVDRVEPIDGGFVGVDLANGERLAARQVIVATGPFRQPNVPAFAAENSIRRSGSCTRTTTATRPSSARAPSSSSASRTPAPTSRSRPPTPATGRSFLGKSPASCRCGSPTGSGPMIGWPVVGVHVRARLHAAHADGRADAPEIREGGGPLIRVRLGDLDRAGRRAPRRKDRRRPGRPPGARRRHGARRGERDLGHRLPARLLVRRGADRRRGWLADRGAWRQPGCAGACAALGVPFRYAFSPMLVAAPAAATGPRRRTGLAKRHGSADGAGMVPRRATR